MQLKFLLKTFLLTTILYSVSTSKTQAQFSCAGPNLLLNPSFETPVVPNVGGANNIVASIPNWTNYSVVTTSVNVVRVVGTGSGGPDTAAQGNQYIDLQGGTGIMDQKFTLTAAAALHFSGKFANRVYTNPGYVGGQIGLQIFDTSMNVVAVVAGSLSAADAYNWKTLSGMTSVLPAGTYTFRFFARTDFAHYDDMSVCVATNAATACANKVVMTNPGTWTATASGNLAGWGAANIIDGSINDIAGNSWVSPTTTPAGSYVTLDLGSAMDLVGFVYYARNTNNQDIASYTAQYSNDGTNFTPIQTSHLQRQQSVYANPTGNPIEANFASLVNARYLRIIVNTTHDANSYASILELLPIVCTTTTLPTISCSNSSLMNSGTDSTGTAKKEANTFDYNWKIAYVKGRTGVNSASVTNRTFLPAMVIGNKAPGAWINSPYSNAEWIGYALSGYDVNSNGAGDGTSPNTYFYKYQFNIADAYALAAFKLKIDFYVDNFVDNIYVNGTSYAATLGLPAGSFLAGSQVSATLNTGWQLGTNEVLIQTASAPGFAGFLIQNITGCLGVDFGDAPATYAVSKASNGPGHIVETNPLGNVTLRLGSGVDVETDGTASAIANYDDTTGVPNDENGMTASFPGIPDGPNPAITNYSVTLAVHNITGAAANLCGWIDWNVNGTFEAGEGVCTTVANGATTATLTWPSATFIGTAGTTSTFARFRITSDAMSGGNPEGPASNGEVEDYNVNFPPICITKVVKSTDQGWTATASATGSGTANQIVDGSLNTGWTSTSPGAGSFVTIDFDSAIDLTGFVYYPLTVAAAEDINAYTVSYSNDGTNFTNIQSGNLPQQSYVGANGTGSPAIVTFFGTFNARYLRLTANSTYQGNAAGIAELLPIVCEPPAYSEVSCLNANQLNTGTDSVGTGMSPANVFDRNWEVAAVANNTAADYTTVSSAIFLPAIVTGNAIPAAWSNSPFGNAEWIAYTPTAYDANQAASGPNDYFFRYRFTISDPYQLQGFKLKLNFMADNQVQNVYINGVGQAPQPGLPQADNSYTYGGFQLANQSQTVLRNNWQLGMNEIVVHVKSYPGYSGFLGQNITTCTGLDFGDAPVSYNVTKAVNGASHVVEVGTASTVTLHMGTDIDAEPDGVASVIANNDDTSGLADEDGITAATIIANYCTVTNYDVTVNITNHTGDSARLVGWIDWNGNGTFEVSEGMAATVDTGTSFNTVLNWTNVNVAAPQTDTVLFARFRITTDPLATDMPDGIATDGEVEDYRIPITWVDYDFGNLPTITWPVALASIEDTDAAWLGIAAADEECATNTADSTDGFTITNAAGGTGTNTDPWQLTDSVTNYTCQLTVNGNGAPKPVYWAMWFDVDGNGSFTDANDIFQNGSLVHGSPVSTPLNITIPASMGGASSGAIRIAASAVDPTFTQAMNGTGNFSNGEVEDYYVAYVIIPLPLELIEFNAAQRGNDGWLTWTTASEQNTDKFIVEHSLDGKVFTAIGSVGAAGNSSTQKHYSFLHKAPGNGSHFYRLKMRDLDGRIAYSETRILNFGNYSQVLVYPNPAKNNVTVTGLTMGGTLHIMAADGRIVQSNAITNNTETVSLQRLTSGMYILQAVYDGRVMATVKLIKE